MIINIGNWYKVLNQVLKIIIKLSGQYQLKNNTCIFINTLKWWKCGSPNNVISCAGICMSFLLWEKCSMYSTKSSCKLSQLSFAVSLYC